MNQTDEVELFWQRRLPVVTLSCCESLVKTVEMREKMDVLLHLCCLPVQETNGPAAVANILALLTLTVNQSPFTIREVHVRQ
ncbi:Ribosomal RNA small subunit methyltransferase [Trichinella spiralis]|uniref:Ribosomal RNA small subunit methyltransferase n=1 Tax=Trichinella spiralis TaxID=6334 RepID=A0ABR3K869_TRISP